MGETSPPSDDSAAADVLWWGEDGEWIVADGHVPLGAFLSAARPLLRGADVDPSDLDDPRYRWWRPVRREDCASEDEWDWKSTDQWRLFTDDPNEPGAEPVTVLDMPW